MQWNSCKVNKFSELFSNLLPLPVEYSTGDNHKPIHICNPYSHTPINLYSHKTVHQLLLFAFGIFICFSTLRLLFKSKLASTMITINLYSRKPKHPYNHTTIRPYAYTPINKMQWNSCNVNIFGQLFSNLLLLPVEYTVLVITINPWTPINPYTHTSVHSYAHTPIHLYTHVPILPYNHTPIHLYNYTPIHP